MPALPEPSRALLINDHDLSARLQHLRAEPEPKALIERRPVLAEICEEQLLGLSLVEGKPVEGSGGEGEGDGDRSHE